MGRAKSLTWVSTVFVLLFALSACGSEAEAPTGPAGTQPTVHSSAAQAGLGEATGPTLAHSTFLAGESYYEETALGTYENEPFSLGLFELDGTIAIISGGQFVDVFTGTSICPVPSATDGLTILAVCMDGDGFGVLEADFDIKEVTYRTVSRDGLSGEAVQLQNYPGNLADVQSAWVHELMADESYVYIRPLNSTHGYGLAYSKTGERQILYNNCMDICISGGNLYLASAPNWNQFMRYEVASRKTETITARGSAWQVYAQASRQEIYLMTRQGIEIFDRDMNNLGEVFTFGIDSTAFFVKCFPVDFVVIADGGIVMVNRTDGEWDAGRAVMQYTPAEGSRPEREVTVSITAPYRDQFVVEAIILYERQNPDQKVSYEYMFETQEEWRTNAEIASTQYTLSLMTGDMGDIVLVGGAKQSIVDIFRTDVFVDLKAKIEALPYYSELNHSFINGVKIEGAIRGLPLNAVCQYIHANTDLLDRLGVDVDLNSLTWSQALDLLYVLEEIAPDAYLFNNYTDGSDEFIAMLNSNLPNLVDLEAQAYDLRQDWFVQLIEKWKAAAARPQFLQVRTNDATPYDSLQDALFSLTTGNNSRINTLGLYAAYKLNISASFTYTPIFSGEQAPNQLAYTSKLYGINARSNRQEAAWQFLSFMASLEPQLANAFTGTPINTVAARQALEQASRDPRSYAEDFTAALEPIEQNVDYLYDFTYYRVNLHSALEKYLNSTLTLDAALAEAESAFRREMFE